MKGVSSNDADWIHDLRTILIAAQKNYVLDAPLGDRPIAGTNADVLKRRETYEMFRGLKLGFQTNAHVKRYETSDKFLKPAN